MTEVRFREVQHLSHPLIWLIVIGITALAWWSAVQQLFLGVPFGTNPAPDEVVVLIFVIFGLLFPLFALVMTLTVEMREDGIYYRLFPLHLTFRVIPWVEIRDMEACTYRPLAEFGGWGIRWGGRNRRAYTTGGNRGVRVHLRDGRMILLGSREPEVLVAAGRTVRGAPACPCTSQA
ncbi:hypothetical protein E2N92_05005 [Methanofollis formosanus]|uniref:Uncharacterized protein n=1 Tax=Methanofollis formosanus TaxID=299308 RepID=A0A8G1A096_9EURY|nr:DUF6141 family protein [Methanofollis formosanus]QYZ78832.1 hypothetical protein E2N92_05005 [Methanofollis formosanus]